ncbi:MAG: phytoene/squalene synthase family protein [Gordonia sp. (in: high G+C Gram-positive bacteria)]|uniref:phytoene/squalene synthase family protein n=1 Tax=Gordonia sp. (in: high G+C Gram-positive bacteria) TaxID=84139 RepID=UPI0039E42150
MTDDGYALARALTARAGRTYYLASALLPPAHRRGVFALYGFARMTDDVVDGTEHPPRARAAALDAIESGLHAALSDTPPEPGSPAETLVPEQWSLLGALADTVRRFGIDPATFDAFLHSMRMDVPGTPEFRHRYRTLAELAEYTHGSAAVIGRQMLPILGVDATAPDHARTAAGAELLGEAFQLTNFLRDVGEDLDRDRIYLPLDELAAFGVDEVLLRADKASGTTSRPTRRALAHLIAINRDQYRRTRPAVVALPPRTRPAIAAAAVSYEEILTAIEASGYEVFARRAVVPRRRRLRHTAWAAATAGRRL